MAYRFVRAGSTANMNGPNVADGRLFLRAQAPAPNATIFDDPDDLSNLGTNGDTDPIYVGELVEATVFLYSDATCSSKFRVYAGATPTGPWSAMGSATTDNPSLAAPVLIDVFEDGRCEYVKITTSAYATGNPRALLVGLDF